NWFGQLLLPPGTNTLRAFAQDIAGNVGPADIIVVRFVNPTNDNFGDAIELVGLGGVVTAVNERATREPGEPLHAGNEGGHSIWYKFRAPVNGTLFRSEEHTSELQSRENLVCRLLLENKKTRLPELPSKAWRPRNVLRD